MQDESYARVVSSICEKFHYKEQVVGGVEISADELQPLRFQGQFYDGETALHYNRFRYYDPDIGMFISRDPIGLMGGDNIFQYAPNPVQWINPLGLTVSGVYNKSTGLVTLTDNNTGKSVSAPAYSGKPNQFSSAPNGTYTISDFPWGSSLQPNYYALVYHDKYLNDYIEDMPTDYPNQKYPYKGNIRLHSGRTSHGCVTVIAEKDEKLWLDIQNMLESTEKGKDITIDGRAYPNFGTFKVIGEGFGSVPNSKSSNNNSNTTNNNPQGSQENYRYNPSFFENPLDYIFDNIPGLRYDD